MKIITFLIGFAFLATASAQDIRDKVVPAAVEEQLPNLIDPDVSIYGIPFGVSEDEFIVRYGNATGYVRITPHESGMIYGRSHCFFFTDGKLSGVRITSSIFDWSVGNRVSSISPFSSINWNLDNGLSRDSNLTDMKRILGDKLVKDGPQYYYQTDTARVDIEVAHLTTAGDIDGAWRVHGLIIRKR